jgi:hypothetical protein
MPGADLTLAQLIAGSRDPVGDRGMLGAADHVRGEQRPYIQAMLTSYRRDIWG